MIQLVAELFLNIRITHFRVVAIQKMSRHKPKRKVELHIKDNRRCLVMDTKKVFNQIILERHTNYEEMAAKLGMNTQSLRNKG